MTKITPFLWFNTDAEEAAKFYTSTFKESKITSTTHYDAGSAQASGMKEGSVMTVGFTLDGQEFAAINGGPQFTFAPSVSFMVFCDIDEIDYLWKKLSHEGKILMALDKYPFAERYGWVQDKYGLSWQLIVIPGKSRFVPTLMFTKAVAGKSEEAMKFYTALFKNSKIDHITRYDGKGDDAEGTVAHARFTLDGQEFAAMDSARKHEFDFNQAVSFVIHANTQKEIDHFYDALAADGGMEIQCGWVTDKFGVPWQVTPDILPKLLGGKDKEKATRAMAAMLTMKKLDIKRLEDA